MASYAHLGSALLLSLAVAAGAAACGGGSKTSGSAGTGGSHTSSASGAGATQSSGTGGMASGASGTGGISFSGGTGGSTTQGLDVEPKPLQTITVTAGQTMPTVTYKATLNGKPISVGWGVDLGNVATLPAGPSSSAVFAPTGSAGGLVTLTAGLNGKTVKRQVMVKLTATQNGPSNDPSEQAQIPSSVADLTAGGGVGGVGGEGLGAAFTGFPTTTMPAAMGLALLYPYDKTVFPRGLLAPLLQWTWAPGDADAIQIGLSTADGSFTYTGTFGRPAILQMTGGKFIRMPIPEDVWEMATNSAGGAANPLTVSLMVAKGGTAYGPITETWTIAPARLSGTIYYNSYGTQLAQNYAGAVGGNHLFGGAVLSIHVGDTGPKLVAGTNTMPPDVSGCRVCHSVAALGTRLVVQHGDSYGTSSAYDLGTTGSVEHGMAHDATFPAVSPDGSMALTTGGTLLPLPNDGTPITTMGLTSVVTNLGTPAFSPDGSKIVFNPLAGPGITPTTTLYVMDFDGASAFSSATRIAQTTAPNKPGWAAFFPDSKSVVFQEQTTPSLCDGPSAIVTRSGARSQLYWTDLSGTGAPTPLDQLNGKGYLPKLASTSGVACNDACGNPPNQLGTNNGDHSDDVDVNYEPTVNPIASGGYAWVVFTSRRMYGNVATIGSFCSDPRGVDLIQNITPKKLWVAAVDLTQGPGVDASHPAFYLPAQELLAGNARGFWVLDPCQPDGTSCTTGDQCCNGYCEANGDGGALICSNTPPSGTCSMPGDKCKASADCCNTGDLCINGFCTQSSPG